jgi:hypothetical protein
MSIRLATCTLSAATVTLWAHTVSEIMTWKIGDDTRSATVYPPSQNSASDKAALIFSFHGHGDDMQNFHMHRAWPEAIVVYFQGLASRRDGLSGWQVEKGQDGDRDQNLVDAALMSLRLRSRWMMPGSTRLPSRISPTCCGRNGQGFGLAKEVVGGQSCAFSCSRRPSDA